MNKTRVIHMKARRRKKTVRVRAWRKNEVANQFRQAKVNWPEFLPQKLTTDGATIGVNRILGERLHHHGHRALEEVRDALHAYAGRPSMVMNLNRVDNMRSDAGDNTQRRRFCLWYWYMSLCPVLQSQRDSVMLFAIGCGLTEIEKIIRVRRGVGKAKELIENGVREYCELAGWVKATFV